MAPTIWDHDAHLALLQAMMQANPPTSPEWDQILALVAEKGYEYSPSAALYGLPTLSIGPSLSEQTPQVTW